MWESREYADAWNFGPDEAEARTVQWIVEQLGESWDEAIAWERDSEQNPHEAHYLKVDSSKARAELGWAPTWSLAQALASIVYWYQALRSGADLRALALDQIAAFEAGEAPVAA
jgi:CDP-glucose 4,6-dehydratase